MMTGLGLNVNGTGRVLGWEVTGGVRCFFLLVHRDISFLRIYFFSSSLRPRIVWLRVARLFHSPLWVAAFRVERVAAPLRLHSTCFPPPSATAALVQISKTVAKRSGFAARPCTTIPRPCVGFCGSWGCSCCRLLSPLPNPIRSPHPRPRVAIPRGYGTDRARG